MKPNDAVRQYVFFNHIGQLVGGGLAVTRESVKALGQLFHDPGRSWHYHKHHQGQFPVQVHQIGNQGHQGKAIARQTQQRRNQLGGAVLYLIDQGVRERAGGLLSKNGHFSLNQSLKQRFTQCLHAIVGDSGQGILRHKKSQSTNQKDANHGNGDPP